MRTHRDFAWPRLAHLVQPVLRIAALGAGVWLIGCFPGFNKSDHIEVGTITHKIIKGHDADGLQTLYEKSNGHSESINDSVRVLIGAANEKLVIAESVDRDLRQVYSLLEYRVKVRLCIRRTTEEYIVTREVFNALQTGIIVKFALNSAETEIDSLIEY